MIVVTPTELLKSDIKICIKKLSNMISDHKLGILDCLLPTKKRRKHNKMWRDLITLNTLLDMVKTTRECSIELDYDYHVLINKLKNGEYV